MLRHVPANITVQMRGYASMYWRITVEFTLRITVIHSMEGWLMVIRMTYHTNPTTEVAAA